MGECCSKFCGCIAYCCQKTYQCVVATKNCVKACCACWFYPIKERCCRCCDKCDKYYSPYKDEAYTYV